MTVSARTGATYELGRRYPFPDRDLTFRHERPDAVGVDEVQAVIELLTRAYNGGPSWFGLGVRPEDHLEWKSRAFAGPSRVTFVEDASERIVGFYLHLLHRFLLRGEEVSVDTGGYDYCLDPMLQGQGISTVWTEMEAKQDIGLESELALGYSLHPTSRMRRGLPTIRGAQPFGNQIESLARPLGLRQLLSAARERAHAPKAGSGRTRKALEARSRGARTLLRREYAALAFAALRSSLLQSRVAPPDGLTVRTVPRFDERIDTFWPRAAGAFDFIQVRDREYLNWRFCDTRGGDYVVRLAEVRGEVVGYAALRRAGSAVALDDLLVLPGRGDVAYVLAADAIAFASEQGAAYVRTWLPRHHPYRTSLAHLGFVRYSSPLIFTYTPGRLGADELRFLREPYLRLHVMNADTDHN